MLDPTDAIHEACDFLVPESPYELARWVEVNESLHAADHWNRWPSYLVAFASNGCGDYFAYNLLHTPPRIVYLDPDYTVTENLEAADRLEYISFDEWYESRISRQRNKT